MGIGAREGALRLGSAEAAGGPSARLFDVAPDGTELLITRGAYRLDDDPRAGVLELPLYGNHWRLRPGHRIRLDLTQVDTPTYRLSNLASSISFPGRDADAAGERDALQAWGLSRNFREWTRRRCGAGARTRSVALLPAAPRRGGAAGLVPCSCSPVGRAGGAGGGDDEPRRARAAAGELPRGGRTILPGSAVVAFYGAPQDRELGVLGIGSPRRAASGSSARRDRMRAGAARCCRRSELIAAIVTSEAGDGGDHSMRQDPRRSGATCGQRAHDMLMLLDIQPGYAPFLQEAQALEDFLKEPDVSLALDPEWSMDPPQLSGQEIGSTDAATVNEVSRYLSGIVRRYDLPQKLLVVHRFTGDMIQAEHDLERHPGVALVVNVDGFGDQPNKISKYREFTKDLRRRFNGFKLFYEEDVNLMKPDPGPLRLPAAGPDRSSSTRDSGALPVEQLQQLVRGQFDVLMAPLGRAIVARDEPHSVDSTEVSVDSTYRAFVSSVARSVSPRCVCILVPRMLIRERRSRRSARGWTSPIPLQNVLARL